MKVKGKGQMQTCFLTHFVKKSMMDARGRPMYERTVFRKSTSSPDEVATIETQLVNEMMIEASVADVRSPSVRERIVRKTTLTPISKQNSRISQNKLANSPLGSETSGRGVTNGKVTTPTQLRKSVTIDGSARTMSSPSNGLSR